MKREPKPLERDYKVSLIRQPGLGGIDGFIYDVSLGGLAIVSGWTASTRHTARKEAIAHADERLATLTRAKAPVPA